MKLPNNWRDMTPMELVNKTGLIPCGSCGEIIYELRVVKKFSEGDAMSAHDFKGFGEIVDPIQGDSLICPKCKNPMIVDKEK